MLHFLTNFSQHEPPLTVTNMCRDIRSRRGQQLWWAKRRLWIWGHSTSVIFPIACTLTLWALCVHYWAALCRTVLEAISQHPHTPSRTENSSSKIYLLSSISFTTTLRIHQNEDVDKNSSSENSRLKKNAAMSVAHGNIANAKKKSNNAQQFNELLICISQT